MEPRILAFEDFHAGMEIALGSYEVTASELAEFAARYDPGPPCIDGGEPTQDGTGAASPWHVTAMAMRLICDGFILRSTSQGAPGVDWVEWTNPVHAGDTLTGTSTILSTRRSRSRPGLGFVQVRHEIRNQRGELVCAMENPGMMGLRDAQERP